MIGDNSSSFILRGVIKLPRPRRLLQICHYSAPGTRPTEARLQDQIQITELVPEIFSRDRFFVRGANRFWR